MTASASRPCKSYPILLAAAISLSLASNALAADRRHLYDIPAQDAVSALQEFARQSGRQVLFPYAIASGRRVEALRGDFEESEALRRLLEQARLRVISDDGTTITLGEQSRPAGTAADGQVHSLDRVTVTGSHIKRVQVEGPAPVLVVSAADIEAQGATTVYEALETLTQFTGGVQNEMNTSGFTPNASVLNMRGLGPNYNLILLNGHRLADYPQPYNSKSSAVDLNTLPAAAIERIELLSSGASSIYGSDAVSGVINIITRTGIDSDRWSLRGGTTTMGGGDNVTAQWTGGKSSDKASLSYAFEYYAREMINGYDRDFMDSVRDSPDDSAVPSSGVWLRTGSGAYSGYIWPDGIDADCGNFSDFEVYSNSSGNRYCGYFGRQATASIQNERNRFSSYLYGTYDFDNGLQAYAQLLASYSRDKSEGSAQYWASGYYYDENAGASRRVQRYFSRSESGPQPSEFKSFSWNLSSGLRGHAFDDRFDWDFNLNHSYYKVDRTRTRLSTNAVTAYFLGEALGTRSNGYTIYAPDYERLFSEMDAETFASLNTTVRYNAESEATTGSLIFSGDLFELPAGPVGMAIVAEAGRQSYDVNPDERITPSYTGTDLVYNLTATGGSGDRDHYATGIEFSLPLTARLNASVSGRYDYYDDISSVGGAFTWATGLEYRPTGSLLLRGNYATSFRAPDLHYLHADLSGSYIDVTDQFACRQTGIDPSSNACTSSAASYYVEDVYSTREGNADLTEETGRSWGVGAVWDIADGMSASLDYYDIRLNDAVADISTRYLLRQEAACRAGSTWQGTAVDIGSASCQAWLGMVQRDENGEIESIVRTPYNQSMMRTSGLDANWKYGFDIGSWGRLDLKAGYTHVLKMEVQEFPGDEITNTRDDPAYYNFRSRSNWQARWSRHGWSATLYGYRYGSLPSYDGTTRIAPYLVWNASLSRRITDNATLALYVNNMFNNLHPQDDSYTEYPYFYRAYSAVGRTVAAQFSYRFD